eukprot:CAMPEP_0116541212 /NCGR_PEP_ID=MMETSP0397-20121206/363_1 /TAXON_ID=216820 /ORGANISM="Cyclophora tenuis, Strain ECT3854" /LENGTH=187 /DNA_ID=CAMNT_0004065141 /DNA_START=50 /DNA_END=613 /DNA_ORIENTATION=-
MSLQKYAEAETKLQKSLIVMSIVDMFRSNSPLGGGFVRQDRSSGLWYEIGDEAAREKVGQTIRETLVQQDPEKRAKKRIKRALNKARKAQKKPSLLDDSAVSESESSSSSCRPIHPLAKAGPTYTEADEMLAAIPPQLVLESSRDWFKPKAQCESDTSSELSDDDFDSLFDLSPPPRSMQPRLFSEV